MSASTLAIALGLIGPVECTDTVAGRVIDQATDEPITGAVVRLGEAEVETDETGHFELVDVCPGDHALFVEGPDHEPVKRDVSVHGHVEVDVHALLREHGAEHEDHVVVQVEAAQPTQTKASTTLDGERLARTRGQDFAEALSGVAGVSVLRSSAGGMGKPIIRGQYGRRNLILNNGVRHEGQRWGIDHAPEIDPLSAGSITVIKGAGSIRYGPDAVGGVVLVEPPPLPRSPGVSGQAHLVGSSNARRGLVAGRVDGAHRRLPGFVWRAEGNVSRGGSEVAPDYPLDNTAALLWNAGGTLGYLGKDIETTLSYRRHFMKAGLCSCLRNDTPEAFEQSFAFEAPIGSELYQADYEIERAFQRVTHDLALARMRAGLGRAGQLTATYAFQDNRRMEFDIVRTGVEGPQIDFELRTHMGELAFEHAPVVLGEGLWLEGTAGTTVSQQDNVFNSNRTLIPDYDQWSGGAFVLERVSTQHFEMQWGIRYDGMLRTSSLSERDYLGQTNAGYLDPDECERTSNGGARCSFPFHAASGSYGVLVRATDSLDLRLDLSSTARFPNVDEHFLNGIAPSFPVLGLGGSALGVERTWGASPSVSYANHWIANETSVYANYIDDYIYFAPEPSDGPLGLNQTVRGTFPVFSFRPVDAVFYGGEEAFAIAPPKWPVSFDGQVTIVRAIDVANREFLVFVPADRYRLGITYHWPEFWKFTHGFVSVGGTFVDRQRRTDPEADFAPPPPAYFLLGASAGVQVPMRHQLLSIGIEGNNLTNARYRQYTSLLRYFADEPGWDLRLRLSLDFTIHAPRRHRD